MKNRASLPPQKDIVGKIMAKITRKYMFFFIF